MTSDPWLRAGRATPAELDACTNPTVTWLGHASVVVELGGVRVMTDPALTDRVAHLRRHHRLDVGALDAPHVLLISHVHMDHLHVPSLRLLGPGVPLIVPAGAAGFLRRRGFRHVRETAAGRTTQVGHLTIETVPAAHSGRRGPHSRMSVDAVGYVLRAPGGSVYFPGDTDLFPEMAALDDIDVALFPIGGWGPTVGEGHLDPRRAVEATGLVQPGLVVPIHWGTYSPVRLRRGAPGWLGDPARRFRSEMEGAGLADRLRVLQPGGTLRLPAPEGRTPPAARPAPSTAGRLRPDRPDAP